MKIPLIYIKEKQVFVKENGMLKFIGKPLDVAKKLKENYKLIHIVDEDALKGLSRNLDIYDRLTYFINVQVECAPDDKLVKKLLSLRCRVVLTPGQLDLTELEEKNLLVAKIRKDSKLPLDEFNDVIIEDADEEAVKKFSSMGKRVIVYENEIKGSWGTILFLF